MQRTVMIRGTGSIGMRHQRAFADLGHRAILVPTRDGRLAELTKLGHEVAATPAEAVARGATAAVIATDTARHVDDAIEALERGFSVLVEKPVATELGELPALETACAGHQGNVHVAYCLRFLESLNVFRRTLASIGDVHAVRIVCQSYLPEWRPTRDYRESYSARADEGGVLRDLSHEIDYAIWLFGPPRDIVARIARRSRLGIAAEESADLLWRTDQEATVSMRLDYLTRHSRRSMLAQGDLGELEWNGISGEVELRRRGEAARVLRSVEDRDAMMRAQAAAFLTASGGSGDHTDLCDLQGAKAVMRVVDAARHAS